MTFFVYLSKNEKWIIEKYEKILEKLLNFINLIDV